MKTPILSPRRGCWWRQAAGTALALGFIGLLSSVPETRAAAAAPPSEASILATLRAGHPRLLVLAEDLERIRTWVATDPTAKGYYASLQRQGESILKAPPVQRVLIGPRLLDKSRTVVDRLYTLGLLFRLDEDPRWADRAIQELRAVAVFSDWNPSHFLDVAEMTHGFALGYDWFYGVMSAQDRTLIREAMVDKGLREAEKIYRRGGSWTQTAFNWNNVCNGGILSGALAVADEEPALARYLVAQAVQSLPLALATYAPDGAWAEGPGYWGYATRYTIVAFASLQSALGTDFGLSAQPGMAEAGAFRICGVGPTGLFFNFADAGERSGDEPSLFWLARRYHNPVYAGAARLAAQSRASAQDLIFYDPRGQDTELTQLPLDRHFRGADIVFFRSAWLDPEAIYLAGKGGDNKANHSNLDLGTFVLDALGERWAIELGADDYNLPGYFGNLRWTYYRLRTEGQNTLLMNGANQDPKAAAPVMGFRSGAEGGRAVIDLTAGYAGNGATQVLRGFALLDQRRRVLIQDDVQTREPVDLVWAMHTKAAIELSGKRATLRQDGKQLSVSILSPDGARFDQEEVSVPPPQRSTAGIRKLLVRWPEKISQTRLAILLSPGTQELPASAVALQPLTDWISKP